ncbi:MAG TPA: lipocalin family protein [Flavisolibacter sp.]|nr:lipocalin family protein [Flavisolibacter sp.]
MKKTIIALSFIAILFSSCKKDNDSPKQVTPTQENLTGTYIITAARVGNGGAYVNVFNNPDPNANFFEPCERDDQYKLNANLSYAVIDAGTACSPTTADDTGTWSLTSATSITMDGEVYTIKSFDGTTLVVTDTSGGPSYEVTFVKQ